MADQDLPDFLPGDFLIERGTARNYAELASFHYVAKRPATWAGIWCIKFLPHRCCLARDPRARTVGIGVLSYPVPSCRARERFLGLSCNRNENLDFINGNLRTISRIIIHPQFRAIGLSTALVRCLCDNCPTRFVEAIAMMGRVHPLFERAGMMRIEPATSAEPAYFIFDRNQKGACTCQMIMSPNPNCLRPAKQRMSCMRG